MEKKAEAFEEYNKAAKVFCLIETFLDGENKASKRAPKARKRKR